MSVFVHISFSVIYEFRGWLFEYDKRKPFGPWPLKKDFSPRKRAGAKFYEIFGEFVELPEHEQQKYLIK